MINQKTTNSDLNKAPDLLEAVDNFTIRIVRKYLGSFHQLSQHITRLYITKHRKSAQ